MSRYYKSYDAYGEPVTILSISAEAPATHSHEARFEREAKACIDAEDLYETLRHEGKSHIEARAAVTEKFGI